MKAVRLRGDERDLRRLRLGLFNPHSNSSNSSSSSSSSSSHSHSNSVVGWPLSTWDINETISLCLRRDRDTSEAMQWLLTAFPMHSPSSSSSSSLSPSSTPPPYCQPNDLTYSMLLTAAAADKQSWEVVFYLLAEMRLRGIYSRFCCHRLLSLKLSSFATHPLITHHF